MRVRITDEFNTTWDVSCESTQCVLNLVEKWLENRDQTPIYEILIEIDHAGSEKQ
jgi:hypothetical protein